MTEDRGPLTVDKVGAAAQSVAVNQSTDVYRFRTHGTSEVPDALSLGA